MEEVFGAQLSTKLIHVKAQSRFLDALVGVTDPETKRKLIGETFIKVFEEVSDQLPECRFLVQGTLYPDVIESGGGDAAVIKSHHNVGGLPAHMRLELVEPLRDLFKDEVRGGGNPAGSARRDSVASSLPRPGSGDPHHRGGDPRAARPAAPGRRHRHRRNPGRVSTATCGRCSVCCRRCVRWEFRETSGPTPIPWWCGRLESSEAMTADWARLPYEVLGAISRRVIGEVEGINRVLYDVSSKPPATIEWE